jgi:hypothetical protein
MAMAMIYRVLEKGGRGKKKTMDETSTLFSPKRLQLARTVLAHSPDLAQAVLAGSMVLDAAYDEARKAKQLLDAQVAGNVRRKVARSKKGTSHEIDALANACRNAPMSYGNLDLDQLQQDLSRIRRCTAPAGPGPLPNVPSCGSALQRQPTARIGGR